MVDNQSQIPSRRTILKATGAPLMASMAGCLDGILDSGGSSGLRVVSGPSAYYAVVMQYVQNENILENNLDDAGYSINDWVETFDERPLLAGDQVDVAHPSPQEASQIAAEIDEELAIAGRVATNFLGFFVESGGEYDPENTGGVDQTIQQIADDGATVGIGTFGGSDFPGHQVLFDAIYDMDFGEQESDFDVRGIGYAAVADAIVDGDIAMGSVSPMHGASSHIREDSITELFYVPTVLTEANIGIPMQVNCTCRESYIQDHEPAVKAFVDAWAEGLEWWYENGADAMEEDQYFDAFDWADNVENAKYAQNWATQNLPNEEENPNFPVLYRDPHLTDDYIESSQNFLDNAASLGLAPEDWSDYVNYHQLN